jgi:hypothetical protein
MLPIHVLEKIFFQLNDAFYNKDWDLVEGTIQRLGNYIENENEDDGEDEIPYEQEYDV